MKKEIDPWTIPTLTPERYEELKNHYSLEDINFSLKEDPNFMKRNLLVGQDNFNIWLKNAKNKKKVAIVSGFMTSGTLHFGSLFLIRQIAYFQKKYGVKIIIPISDIEAISVRGSDPTKTKEVLVDFLAHFFAEGIDPNKTLIYLQGRNSEIMREAVKYMSKTDFSVLKKVYGRNLTLAEAYSSLVMSADILMPKKKGYVNTLILLGIDEIGHFILVKKLLSLLQKDYSPPSILYDKLITGLNGSKMGKSLPENSILLTDSVDVAKSKLNNLRGRKMKLYENSAYNILEWFCDDDEAFNEISRIKDRGKANELSIDLACNLVEKILTNHRKNYKKMYKKAQNIASKLTKENQIYEY